VRRPLLQAEALDDVVGQLELGVLDGLDTDLARALVHDYAVVRHLALPFLTRKLRAGTTTM